MFYMYVLHKNNNVTCYSEIMPSTKNKYKINKYYASLCGGQNFRLIPPE